MLQAAATQTQRAVGPWPTHVFLERYLINVLVGACMYIYIYIAARKAAAIKRAKPNTIENATKGYRYAGHISDPFC